MKKHDHPHAELAYHLRTLRSAAVPRREIMGWAVSAGLVSLIGCGDDDASGGSAGSGGTPAAGSGGSSCTVIPNETEGPYPADGSNSASGNGMMGGGAPMGGPPTGGASGSSATGTGSGISGGSGGSSGLINALSMTGIVRSDIRSSFGSSTTQAAGIPLTIKLRIVDTKSSCAALAGAAVYIWHCDRSGNYSLYTAAAENYLRGVQVTDANGYVTFTSIFPACYSGRWPHIHYEVYPNATNATSYANKIATSQLAMPKAPCDLVFAQAGYEASISNFAAISLATDNVFSDGSDGETPTITGSVSAGYEASLTAAVTSK